MFLARRSAQAEHFDDPARTPEEIRAGYALLARVNRLFRFAEPFTRLIPAALGPEACRALTLLDVGAGDGALGRELASWAARQGWCWRTTNLETPAASAALNGGGDFVPGTATALPFADGSFDVVLASQMTHHLAEPEVVAHFREAWRVARRLVVIVDLRRHPLLYLLVAAVLPALRVSPEFRRDGLLSVRRGWMPAEWTRLAAEAGLPAAEVASDRLFRVRLLVRKAHVPAAADQAGVPAGTSAGRAG